MVAYVVSTLLLFGIGAVIFYQFGVYQIEENDRRALKRDADRVISMIKSTKEKEIEELTDIKVAVYNGKKEYVFGNFRAQNIHWGSNFVVIGDMLRHSRVVPPPRRKQAAFLVIEKKIDRTPIDRLRQSILYATLFVLAFVLMLGYFLGRLFIAPMRESIKKINLFVQDATHELNTPISTILTNIEMLEILGKCDKNEEFKRIEIASKTLSRIYDDLSYLKLNEEYQRHPKYVDMSALMEERLEYFASSIISKKITLSSRIEAETIKEIDPSDALRLLDNLLSNAIKYNQINGDIEATLDKSSFSVKDTGRGMNKESISAVFDRFHRADESEGGFGIGLDIVSSIAKHYGYTIEIESEVAVGTHIKILW